MNFVLFLAVFGLVALPSAHSMTGITADSLISSDIGLYKSNHGFSIHAKKTDWQLSVPDADHSHIETVYQGPLSKEGVRAALTVRVDQLEAKKKFSKYIRRWKKDYPRLGLKVLGAKRIKINGQTAYLFDLLNESSERQIRQVLFRRKRNLVTLTCRDHRSSFQEQVKACNQIIRNFRWL